MFLQRKHKPFMLHSLYQWFQQYLLDPLVRLLFPVSIQGHVIFVLESIVKIVAILIPLLLAVAYVIYAERKVIGSIQGTHRSEQSGIVRFSSLGPRPADCRRGEIDFKGSDYSYRCK